jgi:predicted nucleic acid-binding Zn ribbon protein
MPSPRVVRGERTPEKEIQERQEREVKRIQMIMIMIMILIIMRRDCPDLVGLRFRGRA